MNPALDTQQSKQTSAGLTTALLITLSFLAALTPFATDMYLPAFPVMTTDLNASASTVQLTLTTFFIGLALGQLLFGPLSDRFGRIKPLIVGSIILIASSIVAALAPTAAILIAARFVQGLTGAAGVVIGRAIVSDLANGKEAARAFSLMMLVSGLAPIVAPFLGSVLVGPIGWRGILWVVAGLSALMLITVLLIVRESHPANRRSNAIEKVSLSASGLTSRAFVANTVTVVFSFSVMMAYIAASPFVYQVIIGMSEVTYGLTFGLNAIGLVGSSALAARLSHTYAPTKILRVGMGIMIVATITLLVIVTTGLPVALIPFPIFFAVASIGLVLGNATALALSAVPHSNGVASAIMGASQFGVAAVVSPIVGIGGENTAAPLAITMFVVAAIAGIAMLVAERPRTLPEPAEIAPLEVAAPVVN